MLIGGMISGGSVQALDPIPLNQVIITEVFPGNPSPNAGQEFIEIYNNTALDIDLSGWHVQYASATKTDWLSPTRTISLSGAIKSGEYYLIASTGYLTDTADITYSSTLSQTGGHLRVIDDGGLLQDQIGWGNAVMPLGVAIPAPPSGSSISRLTNSLGFNLSEDNNTDYAISLSPTPSADNLITLAAVEEDVASSSSPTPSTTPPVTVEYADIQISELLPNPAAPQSDDKDEYVELYNPNSFDVDLSGYIIATGINSTYKYAVKNLVIPAGGYALFKSGDTNLSLSNTTGKAQLMAPDGTLLDETGVYDKALPGAAWIFNAGNWVWTTTATPGLDNIYTQLTFVKAATTTKKAAKAPSKTAKRKSPAAAKTKKKKSVKSAVPLAGSTTPPPAAPIHPLVLAGIGSGALLYALYEYRNDLGNTLYRLRRYREARGSYWPAFASTGVRGATLRLGRWQDYIRARSGPWFR